MPWTANTTIVKGQHAAITATSTVTSATGVTASSGGPSGTATSITDGGVTWTYAFPQFMSVLGSGSGGTIANPGGSTDVTTSGAVMNGVYFSRASGGTSTAGGVTAAIESPWSNGQVGQHQSLAMSFGGGAATETWQYRVGYLAPNQLGILPSDLGDETPFTFAAELEFTNIANFEGCYPYISSDYGTMAQAGPGLTGTGNHIPASSGEMINFASVFGNKLWLVSPKFTPSRMPPCWGCT